MRLFCRLGGACNGKQKRHGREFIFRLLRLLLASSVTYALKSRDLLFQRGIKAYIERLPRTRESGCGYGVYVPQRTDEAERILRDAGVKVFYRAERGEKK